MLPSDKVVLWITLLVTVPLTINAQVPSSELHKTLKSKDSLIFHISFSTCEISDLEPLISQDIEFYHDQSGTLIGYTAFTENLKNGLCANPGQTRRQLQEGSLEVYPLYENGTLYGALQNGVHSFYQKNPEGESLGSVARFSHLWLLQEEEWKLSRVISFDHQ
ncbi:MAG: nuclear transport factor 2 family protein [Cyclobacteriaceae bacterium]|nr:nuclear transport factor 2 family protein [Cyclobacteriaceae bacterium]